MHRHVSHNAPNWDCTHVYIYVAKLCLVGYGSCTLWDLWNRPVAYHNIRVNIYVIGISIVYSTLCFRRRSKKTPTNTRKMWIVFIALPIFECSGRATWNLIERLWIPSHKKVKIITRETHSRDNDYLCQIWKWSIPSSRQYKAIMKI